MPNYPCPVAAVGCQLLQSPFELPQLPHECCVSNNGLLVFAQNYSIGLTYANNSWTNLNIVNEIGNRFTVHGLWPNNCDGSYNISKWNADHTFKTEDVDLYGCDPTRSLQNASEILKSDDMYPILVSNFRAGDGDDNWFWSHEWSKHGTCASTYKPKCFDVFQKYDDFKEYMRDTLEIYNALDIADAFADAAILPSDTLEYSRSDFQNALKSAFGEYGGIQCVSHNGRQYLSEVWIYMLQRAGGSFQITSPDIVTAGAGAWQSCKENSPITFPKTPLQK